MLGVFLVNIYLGLYDTTLSTYNTAHYYSNWAIALVTLVAAFLLLLRPGSRMWVAVAGVVWPLVYLLSLGVDVSTDLCLGSSAAFCWPSTSASFDYLILNSANISGAPGYGWTLAPVMPFAVALLVIVFLLSLTAVLSSRQGRTAPTSPTS